MLALHRKYRPQTVAELDQDKVRQVFERILESGQFSQAYLLAGPKGTGKTSAARILAKIVNCELNSQRLENSNQATSLDEPCNQCQNCVAITKGISPTVIEMDAASNRGIDDIRALRDQINLVPSMGQFTVYIIDEVHMLTTEAFNALLKTLEEPPAHAIFCMATTELHKLPETVISRCSLVKYQKSTSQEIRRALERVVKGEDLTIDPKALQLISQKADGSFRDAVNLIQSLSSAVKPITVDLVDSVGWTTQDSHIQKWLDLIVSGQTQPAFDLLTEVMAMGVNPKEIATDLIEAAMLKVKQAVHQDQQIPEAYLDIVDVFSQAYKRFAEVPIPELALEMAIVEYGLKQGNLNAGSKPEATKDTSTPKTVVKTPPETQQITTKNVIHKKKVKTPVTNLNKQTVLSKWTQVLQSISDHNHGLVTLLKRGQVTDCVDNVIILTVSYEFHKQQLEQDRYLDLIEQCLAEVFGGQVSLSIELKQTSKMHKNLNSHKNVSGAIPAKDTELVAAVEEVFGV